MRTRDRLLRAIRSPRLFVRGLNRLYHRGVQSRGPEHDGVRVFDEDWDTLVVLDACRYDMFRDVNHIEGTLSSRTSCGTMTTEWLRENFDGRDLRDTVYVTANPQFERNRDDWDVNLYRTINVWLEDGWDEEAGTVRAETMTEAGVEAFERYPGKRIVVHYMQPHYPFVPADTTFDKDHLRTITEPGDTASGENVWNQKFIGSLDISRDELWSMYVENLVYALEHVEALLDRISGKTVITSDHGNYVGERASPIPIEEYGHPRGLYDDELVRVPWLSVTDGDRRDVTAESPEESRAAVESEVVAERLSHLGYAE